MLEPHVCGHAEAPGLPLEFIRSHGAPAVPTASFDLIIAHGIWNLARPAVEFRHAVAEAARVAARGPTCSCHVFPVQTLPADAAAVTERTLCSPSSTENPSPS